MELAYILSLSLTLSLAILNCLAEFKINMVEISVIMFSGGLLFAIRTRILLAIDGALYALKSGYVPLKEKDENNVN
jgi:hypothetical protein